MLGLPAPRGPHPCGAPSHPARVHRPMCEGFSAEEAPETRALAALCEDPSAIFLRTECEAHEWLQLLGSLPETWGNRECGFALKEIKLPI